MLRIIFLAILVSQCVLSKNKSGEKGEKRTDEKEALSKKIVAHAIISSNLCVENSNAVLVSSLIKLHGYTEGSCPLQFKKIGCKDDEYSYETFWGDQSCEPGKVTVTLPQGSLR